MGTDGSSSLVIASECGAATLEEEAVVVGQCMDEFSAGHNFDFAMSKRCFGKCRWLMVIIESAFAAIAVNAT